jgi:hypothetical protein
MNYSLFNIETKEMISIEAKRQPGAVLVASHLLSLQFADPYCVFSIFTPPSMKYHKRRIYSQF